MAEVTRISRRFKDISLSFQPHPVTKDLPVLINENAIKQSVKNIVQTQPGEKFFNSLFGSDVRGSLFELADVALADIIAEQIKTSINNFEPRVDNVVVSVGLFPDRNELDVTVNYNIIGQPFPEQSFSFVLEATR